MHKTPTLPQEDTARIRAITRQASQLMHDGQLVVFPTETVYGVGASAASTAGYNALVQIKNRPSGSPFAVHLPTPQAAGRYVNLASPLLSRLIHKIFPGPVTLVLDVSEETIQRKIKDLDLGPDLRSRLYHNHTIGLRCPDHPLAQKLLEAVGVPVLASSANQRNHPPPRDADAARQALGDQVAMTLDGGPSQYGMASTVVRVKRDAMGMTDFAVQREGVYTQREIQQMLRWTLLIVCSGNTCRSPMAQVLAQQILAQARHVDPAQLPELGLYVHSAGIMAAHEQPATQQAVEVISRFGLDLTSHRSRQLTPEMIHEADVVYCMSQSHKKHILDMIPQAAPKIHLLDPSGDIDDPYGQDLTVYARCAEVIRRRLSQRIKEQQV